MNDKIIEMQVSIVMAFKNNDIKTVNDKQIQLIRSREAVEIVVMHVKSSTGGNIFDLFILFKGR
jgi:hypothetical protein